MKIEKILVYIEPTAKVEPLSQFAVELARSNDARVFALSIIKSPSTEKKSRTEEQAWKRLYEVEEDAFEIGIKSSLLLEEMEKTNQNSLTEKILELCKMFVMDILIISSDAKVNLKKMAGAMTIPVIIVPCPKKLIERKD
jgi:hypothetical protein